MGHASQVTVRAAAVHTQILSGGVLSVVLRRHISQALFSRVLPSVAQVNPLRSTIHKFQGIEFAELQGDGVMCTGVSARSQYHVRTCN